MQLIISIHALREEGDSCTDTYECFKRNFYPRPPRGGRPLTTAHTSPGRYFYPRPPRGGRPTSSAGRKNKENFYPRPPRGGRLSRLRPCLRWYSFLSTPSARRATERPRRENPRNGDFYPRPPRGGRHLPRWVQQPAGEFLSTPSARRATGRVGVVDGFDGFLSTPSARRATLQRQVLHPALRISIHALREEGDSAARSFSIMPA